jgi:hypothetical protein
MRFLLVAVLVMFPAVAQATVWELVFFTQDHSVCPPCAPVREMVDTLRRDGHAITIYNYQLDDRPFAHYEVEVTPSFILLKDDVVYRRYVQDAERGHVFTIDLLRGMAPPNGSKELDSPKPTTSRDCAGNGFAKALKNILPVPPPPDNLPNDVPDRVKVQRIEALERMVRDLQLTVNVLKSELADAKSGVTGPPGPAGKDGRDGKDGAVGPQGPPGKDGRVVHATDSLPIVVRIDVVNDADEVVSTETQTYPRGTPVVLRFHEKLLSSQE